MSRNLIKGVILVGIGVLSVFLLANIAMGKVKVVIGGYSNTEITLDGEKIGRGTALARMFMQENPDIDLEYQEAAMGGRDIHTVLTTMLEAKDSTFDIMTADVVWTAQYPKMGWVYPLDEIFPPSEQKGYQLSMIETWTKGGHIYALPFHGGFHVLFYRKDLLENAGMQPPKTWPQLVDIAKKLQKPPKLYGFSAFWQIDLDIPFLEMLWSQGGRLWKEGQVTINGPEGVNALQFMYDMLNTYKILQPGATSGGFSDCLNIWTEGMAVFHEQWYWDTPAGMDPGSKIKGKVGMIGIPKFSDTSPEPGYGALGGWSWAVNSYSKHLKETLEVIKWLKQPRVAKWMALYWHNPPALMSVMRDPEVAKGYPFSDVYTQLMPNTKERFPEYDYFQEWQDRAFKEFGAALLGQKSIKDALDTTARFISKWTGLPRKY